MKNSISTFQTTCATLEPHSTQAYNDSVIQVGTTLPPQPTPPVTPSTPITPMTPPTPPSTPNIPPPPVTPPSSVGNKPL